MLLPIIREDPEDALLAAAGQPLEWFESSSEEPTAITAESDGGDETQNDR